MCQLSTLSSFIGKICRLQTSLQTLTSVLEHHAVWPHIYVPEIALELHISDEIGSLSRGPTCAFTLSLLLLTSKYGKHLKEGRRDLLSGLHKSYLQMKNEGNPCDKDMLQQLAHDKTSSLLRRHPHIFCITLWTGFTRFLIPVQHVTHEARKHASCHVLFQCVSQLHIWQILFWCIHRWQTHCIWKHYPCCKWHTSAGLFCVDQELVWCHKLIKKKRLVLVGACLQLPCIFTSSILLFGYSWSKSCAETNLKTHQPVVVCIHSGDCFGRRSGMTRTGWSCRDPWEAATDQPAVSKQKHRHVWTLLLRDFTERVWWPWY